MECWCGSLSGAFGNRVSGRRENQWKFLFTEAVGLVTGSLFFMLSMLCLRERESGRMKTGIGTILKLSKNHKDPYSKCKLHCMMRLTLQLR